MKYLANFNFFEFFHKVYVFEHIRHQLKLISQFFLGFLAFSIVSSFWVKLTNVGRGQRPRIQMFFYVATSYSRSLLYSALTPSLERHREKKTLYLASITHFSYEWAKKSWQWFMYKTNYMTLVYSNTTLGYIPTEIYNRSYPLPYPKIFFWTSKGWK